MKANTDNLYIIKEVKRKQNKQKVEYKRFNKMADS